MAKTKKKTASPKAKSKEEIPLGFQWIDLDLLVNASWNYKKEDEDMQEKLENNLKQNGQVENIMVRRLKTGFYEVVNGNHRLTAFKKFKDKFEKVMVFNFGEISDAAAERVAIETNETKFEADNVKLAKLIQEIQNEFPLEELQKTLPYNEQDLDTFKNLLEFNWEQNTVDHGTPEDQESSETSATENRSSVEQDSLNRTIVLRLDAQVAESFEDLISRIKQALYPDEIPEKVADTEPLQVIIQKMAQIEDDDLLS